MTSSIIMHEETRDETGGGVACITLTPPCDRFKFRDETILHDSMCSDVHETRLYVVSLQLCYLKTMYYLKKRLHWH